MMYILATIVMYIYNKICINFKIEYNVQLSYA